jgi:hypothetical protein
MADWISVPYRRGFDQASSSTAWRGTRGRGMTTGLLRGLSNSPTAPLFRAVDMGVLAELDAGRPHRKRALRS